ncbi:MAG: hypothetical protein RBR08_15200 [Desulforegulaceae bacterium]|nr:hypothetical protein [Desulforegulaceae bacterium]
MQGILNSSHGRIVFDTETGDIIEMVFFKKDDPKNYLPCITKIDVAEWLRAYPGESLAEEHDILDFGTWDIDGNYEDPCHEWREERNLI